MVDLLSVEIVGIDHSWPDLVLYAIGWSLGWMLLWRPRHLSDVSGRAHAVEPDRRPVAVVIPARDEESSLPHLLAPLVDQARPDDEIVVVDDHSSDATASVADGFGVTVTRPPTPPDGWLGKPNACRHGASATTAPVLVFLDADVRPGPSLLDELALAVDANPDALVSVQPWHSMPTWREQPSLLCNVTALMGCGAFSVAPGITEATMAFGPVMALDRRTHDRVDGHGAPTVRSAKVEDIALAHAIGRSRLAVGSRTGTTFRMYPDGLGALWNGWARSLATGAVGTRWWIGVAVAAWIWSLAAGWITVPLVYPLGVAQVWVLGRRAGTTRPVAALLFPLLVVVFVAVFLRSGYALALRRDVMWKGRPVGGRGR